MGKKSPRLLPGSGGRAQGGLQHQPERASHTLLASSRWDLSLGLQRKAYDAPVPGMKGVKLLSLSKPQGTFPQTAWLGPDHTSPVLIPQALYCLCLQYGYPLWGLTRHEGPTCQLLDCTLIPLMTIGWTFYAGSFVHILWEQPHRVSRRSNDI